MIMPKRTPRRRRASAADDRGYFAAAASRLSLWWRGTSRPQALTADTASGAGLQGGIEDDVPPSNGGAATAPSEGGDLRTDSDPVPAPPRSGVLRAAARNGQNLVLIDTEILILFIVLVDS